MDDRIMIVGRIGGGYTVGKVCVFNPDGISPSVLASSYKDPIKILISKEK